MTQPTPGQRSTCQKCSKPIMFGGQFWLHTDSEPRHRAEPGAIQDSAEAEGLKNHIRELLRIGNPFLPVDQHEINRIRKAAEEALGDKP